MIKRTMKIDIIHPDKSECPVILQTKRYIFRDNRDCFFKTKAYQLDEDNNISYDARIDLKSVNTVDNAYDSLVNHEKAFDEIMKFEYKLKVVK
jgi:hypothetical protein